MYESLGIPVDRQVVEQYLQLPQVASDFANYLQLYDKYKQVYRVDELLSGTWEPVRASELRDAPFDEKLGVLGLLLSRLADGARDAYRLDALTDALHADLLAICPRSAAQIRPPEGTVAHRAPPVQMPSVGRKRLRPGALSSASKQAGNKKRENGRSAEAVLKRPPYRRL